MQLQGAKQRFEAQGLKLAAISYDSPAILKDFAKRHRIDFPLLADPRSEIIRSFNVLNTEAKGMTKGMAYPGFFYIDESGVIREKYVEAKYANRFTANNVIAKLFPELTEEVTQNIEAPHLRLALTQSDRTVAPGSRVTLVAEIELPPGVHVYSAGATGYKPIQLELQLFSGIELSAATYSNTKVLYLERFRNAYRSSRASSASPRMLLTPSKSRDIVRSLVSAEKTISITGELKYQACDKAICYPPTAVPVKWQLQILPLDLKRSPEVIQHK